MLVSGYSGIGKSSVVNELHKALVPPRALFAAGKFDQYKRDIPYSTLAQAFQSLTRPLLTKSDVELGHWRQALREALGPNGQLMVDLVPDLRLIIGDQPLVPELPPRTRNAASNWCSDGFSAVFARPEHPLALFLDDFQWLDAATLDLLEDLLIHGEVQHLLLIGAYRDNEVTPAHPLMRTLEAIRSAGARVRKSPSRPSAGTTCAGCGLALLRPRSARRRWRELVHEKTAGNPFFVIQFLSALVEEGMITFDHGAARWSWDLARIHAKGYTDNVVDLMVASSRRLPTRHANGLAAARLPRQQRRLCPPDDGLRVIRRRSCVATCRTRGKPSLVSVRRVLSIPARPRSGSRLLPDSGTRARESSSSDREGACRRILLRKSARRRSSSRQPTQPRRELMVLGATKRSNWRSST